MDSKYLAKERVSVRKRGRVVTSMLLKPLDHQGYRNYFYRNQWYPGFVDTNRVTYIELEPYNERKEPSLKKTPGPVFGSGAYATRTATQPVNQTDSK